MFTVVKDDTFALSKRAWLGKTDYRLARSPQEFYDYVAPVLSGGDIGLDFEATGLNVWRDKIVGISASVSSGTGIYAPIAHFEGPEYNLPRKEIIEIVKTIDAATDVTQWWYHSDYDHELAAHDWEWRPTEGKFRDALIAVFLEYSDALSHGLKETVDRFFNAEMISYTEILDVKRKKGELLPGFQVVHPLKAPAYACGDADWTRRLGTLSVIEKATLAQSFIWKLEHLILRPVREGINHGVPLDGLYYRLLHRRVVEDIVRLEMELKAALKVAPEFNLRARGALGQVLVDLGVPLTERTPSGQIKTRKGTLAKHTAKYPALKKYVQFSELSSADNAYIVKAIAAREHFGKCVRLQFNTIGAPTGRMSGGGAGRTQQQAFSKGYANLNGQSWPDAEKQPYLPDVRAGVSVAELGDEWVIVAMDYSQVELRILGNVSGEPLWKEAFANGIDIHKMNGALAAGVPLEQVTKAQRKKGKVGSFAIVYQASVKTVAAQLECSEEEAEKIILNLLEKVTRVTQWIASAKYTAEAREQATTYFGRIRRLLGYFSKDGYKTKEAKKRRAQGQREGVNAPIQGAAADVFKIAIHKVAQLLARLGATKDWIQIMWVHDEMVSLVRRSRLYELLPQVKAAMEFEVKGWEIPLKVDVEVGWNWGIGVAPDEKEQHPSSYGRNWGAGLLPWETWLARYPPETATVPLVCWLNEQQLNVAGLPEPPELPPDENADDDEAAPSLDDLLSGV